MKVKNTIAVATLVAIGLQSFGQSKTATIKWGPELKGSKRGTLTETIGYDESGYYVRGVEKSDIYLEKLDKNLNRVATWEFEEKDPDTKMKYGLEGVSYFNNHILLFESNVDKDAKKNVLYMRTVNKKTMAAEGKRKKVSELDYESKRKVGGFDYRISREEEKLMIINFPPPADKEANDRYELTICDSTLNIVWSKKIELPYQNTLFYPSKWIVDDEGNAYVLGKLYKDKVRETRKGIQNFAYHIIAFTNKGQDKVDYEIKIAEKFVTDITFNVNDKGDIVCSGFYSKIGRASIDGCFYMTLDPLTKNVKVSNLKEFGLDFLTSGMTEKQEKKAKKREEKGKDIELLEYDLDKLVLKDDGGCVLIGEQFYIYTTTVSNGKSSYTVYHYVYNDIIVININPEGKIEWAQKIPKRQNTANDGGFYSSYAVAINKEKIRIIFNDHKDNLAPKKQGDWENFSLKDKNGIVTLATIDKDGTVTRESLFSLAETEVAVRPKVCDQINDDQILLFGEKGKLEQFAIVTFK